MRFSMLALLITALLMCLQPVLPASSAEKVELRFSPYYPEHYPVFKYGWQPWEEMVEKESNGTFTFKNYMNGVLHSASHGFRATMSGVSDLTTGYPSYAPKSFHLCMANDLPFIFPTETHVGPLVMESLYAKYLKKEYEKMGVYLGAWVNCSAYNLISKKPVHTIADLKGMKIRFIGGICSEILAALGAVPVMMQSAESYTGLQSGVVDAVLYPDSSSVAYKLYEVAKYVTPVGLIHMGVPYALSKQFFDKLGPDQKDFLYRKLRQASQIASHAYDIDDANARKTMEANGVERITLSDEEIAKMHKTVQPVIDKFIEENEKKGYPAREMMTELKELTEQYKSLSYEDTLKMVTEHPIKGIIDF